jgi:hypothetical protein
MQTIAQKFPCAHLGGATWSRSAPTLSAWKGDFFTPASVKNIRLKMARPDETFVFIRVCH